MSTTVYEFHPHSMAFPLIDGEKFEELVDDIRKNGQLQDGLLLDSKILDGRNRYLACVKLGIEFKCRDVDPDEEDGIALVIALNLQRRHLSPSQVGMSLAQLLGDCKFAKSSSKLAKETKISKRTLDGARRVAKHGAPALQKAVKEGALKVSTAEALSKLPKPEQQAVIIRGPKAAKAVAAQLQTHARKRMPFAAYTVESRTVTPEPVPVPARNGGDPVSIVRACYEKHKAEWNAMPPAAPMLVVETICKALTT